MRAGSVRVCVCTRAWALSVQAPTPEPPTYLSPCDVAASRNVCAANMVFFTAQVSALPTVGVPILSTCEAIPNPIFFARNTSGRSNGTRCPPANRRR